jgi:hypothetical protein
MGWTIGVLGFDSRWGLGIFLFTTASRTTLGPTQPPIQWVPGALSLRVKRPRCEADHSPPSTAEVKEWVALYLHSPLRLHGVVLRSSTETTLPFIFNEYAHPASYPMDTGWGLFPPEVKRPGRETDHSSPSTGKVKDAWRYTSTLQYVFLEWCLINHRENFI